MRLIISSLGILLLLLSHFDIAAGDEIYLKDGTVIKVKSCWEENGDILYEKYGGSVRIQKAKVSEIIRGPKSSETHSAKSDEMKSVSTWQAEQFSCVENLSVTLGKRKKTLEMMQHWTDVEWNKAYKEHNERKMKQKDNFSLYQTLEEYKKAQLHPLENWIGRLEKQIQDCNMPDLSSVNLSLFTEEAKNAREQELQRQKYLIEINQPMCLSEVGTSGDREACRDFFNAKNELENIERQKKKCNILESAFLEKYGIHLEQEAKKSLPSNK